MSTNKFYVPIDLGQTALLLADIQDEIAARLPKDQLDEFLNSVLHLITLFRNEIATRRQTAQPSVPLIIHHVFPAGINANGFISPYNKLYAWFTQLEAAGHFSREKSDPNHPSYKICEKLAPERWGIKDEILIPKLSASCFASSELLAYLRARDIKHVVVCGLTTAGAVLGSARQGADLNYHIVVPKEGVMDDEEEVNEFVLERLLPRFVDVVNISDVEKLFAMK